MESAPKHKRPHCLFVLFPLFLSNRPPAPSLPVLSRTCCSLLLSSTQSVSGDDLWLQRCPQQVRSRLVRPQPHRHRYQLRLQRQQEKSSSTPRHTPGVTLEVLSAYSDSCSARLRCIISIVDRPAHHGDGVGVGIAAQR